MTRSTLQGINERKPPVAQYCDCGTLITRYNVVIFVSTVYINMYTYTHFDDKRLHQVDAIDYNVVHTDFTLLCNQLSVFDKKTCEI